VVFLVSAMHTILSIKEFKNQFNAYLGLKNNARNKLSPVPLPH
jgi:hypothetical protein